MSSREALNSLNKKKASKEEKASISIEEAIRKISTSNNRIDLSKTEDAEANPKIFTKFWSMPNGLNSDRVWKSQREQRAESEIIARQRKHDDHEDESLLNKLKKRHKLSY